MVGCITAVGPAAAVSFYVAAIVVGCYLIMNLFVAILLNTFAENPAFVFRENVLKKTVKGIYRSFPKLRSLKRCKTSMIF